MTFHQLLYSFLLLFAEFPYRFWWYAVHIYPWKDYFNTTYFRLSQHRILSLSDLLTSTKIILFQPAVDITNRKQPRVVFVVSTVNLVTQQKEKFEEYLCEKYTVGEICGANATEIPLKYLLQSHHVVVMTAQILVNALNSENKEERVELKDISMLLFDECHHADKGHPYNSIMENYLAFKFQPGPQPCLPKV